ncbi:DUF123 domain-containing protein [candidate division KSB1 bacterium]
MVAHKITESKKPGKSRVLKGIYSLLIHIPANVLVQIGALGGKTFEKGRYLYVGSAQTNLEKRVKRHLSTAKKRRWHIDYLLLCPGVEVVKTFAKAAEKEEECKTAALLSVSGKPVDGFGCSDCSCISHLFKVSSVNELINSGFTKLDES